MRYLILGGGPAGIAGAKAIRKENDAAEVIIFTEEANTAYLRPLLTGLISGETDMQALVDPQGEDLSRQNIEVRYEKEATAVNKRRKTVTFADGTVEHYGGLLIATGGKPILPPALLRHPEVVFPLNSLSESLRIRDGIERSRKTIVYGPGFLAIEACRVMRTVGQEVVWFKPDLPRHGYPIASGEFESRFLDDLRNRGVTIEEGADVAGVETPGNGQATVRSTTGKTVHCDMIVAATERLPSVRFLEGSGIDIDTGILVDDYLHTSAPDVHAAGDCAEIFDRESGKNRINFGWRSAIKQGQLAGKNMAGMEKRYIRKSEDYLWLIFGPSLKDRLK